jgi:hypothetical protein
MATKSAPHASIPNETAEAIFVRTSNGAVPSSSQRNNISQTGNVDVSARSVLVLYAAPTVVSKVPVVTKVPVSSKVPQSVINANHDATLVPEIAASTTKLPQQGTAPVAQAVAKQTPELYVQSQGSPSNAASTTISWKAMSRINAAAATTKPQAEQLSTTA